MKIINEVIKLKTRGNGDLINITVRVSDILKSSHLKIGNVTVFVIGSTAAITTFEYEPGLIKDINDLFEKIVPSNKKYHHDDTWQDYNGSSHLKASLQGPSITVPFEDNRLMVGTWQQIVLAEFDIRPRDRRVVVQIIGQ